MSSRLNISEMQVPDRAVTAQSLMGRDPTITRSELYTRLENAKVSKDYYDTTAYEKERDCDLATYILFLGLLGALLITAQLAPRAFIGKLPLKFYLIVGGAGN